MLGVPEQILQKPGPLDPEERVRVQAHVEIGVRLLESIPDAGPVSEIVRSHHERWDGTGYPTGLRGEAIPLTARLFAVCDAFDAMTGQRPYRTPLGREEALAELESARALMVPDAAQMDEVFRGSTWISRLVACVGAARIR